MENLKKDMLEVKSILVDIQEKLSKLIKESEKELLTPLEVCRILKIGMRTYRRYVQKGILTQVRMDENSKKVYVKRSELEKLIDEGKV